MLQGPRVVGLRVTAFHHETIAPIYAEPLRYYRVCPKNPESSEFRISTRPTSARHASGCHSRRHSLPATSDIFKRMSKIIT
jgi:hypothetical protein